MNLVGSMWETGGYHLDQNFPEMDHEMFVHGAGLMHWGPIRVSSIHMCVNNPVARVTASILARTIRPDRQARIRIHNGESR